MQKKLSASGGFDPWSPEQVPCCWNPLHGSVPDLRTHHVAPGNFDRRCASGQLVENNRKQTQHVHVQFTLDTNHHVKQWLRTLQSRPWQDTASDKSTSSCLHVGPICAIWNGSRIHGCRVLVAYTQKPAADSCYSWNCRRGQDRCDDSSLLLLQPAD